MVLDKDTKAFIERHHNDLLEQFKEVKRDLVRSNELCDKLGGDNIVLKADNVALKTELADARDEIKLLKKEMTDHKAESAAAIKAAVAQAVEEQKAVIDGLKIDIDDLQQYGRRNSIRVQNVAVVEGENDDDDEDQDRLLASVNARLAPAGVKLEHDEIIRFHRSSKAKEDKDNEGGKVSQVLIKLRNWRIRRRFHGINAEMRRKEATPGFIGCRVYHDLTKRRLALLNDARALCINGWFAYADVNCNLKIRKGEKFFSFNTIDELKALEKEMK